MTRFLNNRSPETLLHGYMTGFLIWWDYMKWVYRKYEMGYINYSNNGRDIYYSNNDGYVTGIQSPYIRLRLVLLSHTHLPLASPPFTPPLLLPPSP